MANYPRDWDVGDRRCELILHLIDDGVTTISQLFTWPLPTLVTYLRDRMAAERAHDHSADGGPYIDDAKAAAIIAAFDVFLALKNPTTEPAKDVITMDPVPDDVRAFSQIAHDNGLFLPWNQADKKSRIGDFFAGRGRYLGTPLLEVNIRKMSADGSSVSTVDLGTLLVSDLFRGCRLRDQLDIGVTYLKDTRDLLLLQIDANEETFESPIGGAPPGTSGNARCCSNGSCQSSPQYPGKYCQSVNPDVDMNTPCNAMSDAC